MIYPAHFMDFEPIATLYEKGDRSIRATMITTNRNRKYLDIRVWSGDVPQYSGVYLTGESITALTDALSKYQEIVESGSGKKYSFSSCVEMLGYNPFEQE